MNNPIKKCTKDLNKNFIKEYIQKANKHIKVCSTSYVNRELQIKMTLRYHYTPIRLAQIQNMDSIKCWRGCGEIGTAVGNAKWYSCSGKQPGSFLQNSQHSYHLT